MNNSYSLFTPSLQRPVGQKPEHVPGSKKRRRDAFEYQTYRILPDVSAQNESMDKKYTPSVSTFIEQEQTIIKTDKALEMRSESLKDNFKVKSEKMIKFKTITQNVDSYVELDEKLIDLINVKDFSSDNEYELCFDEFIKAKSIPLPDRVLEVYKEFQAQNSDQVKCITQIFPEANLVVMTINERLFLWQYYVNNNLDAYDGSYELESRYNEKWRLCEQHMKAPIRAVGLGKPIIQVFPNQDVSYVIAIATSYNIQLYTVSFAQHEIIMKYTDLETNLDDDSLINKIVFSKTGKIFAAQTNQEVVMLNYESGKSFQRYLPFWLNNPLTLQPSRKKNLLTDLTKTLTTLFIQPFQKNYLYSMVDLAIDNTRHILYAYGIKIGNECDFIIQVYDLGATGEDFKLLTVIKTFEIKQEIRLRCKLEETELNKLRIAAMIPVEKNLSENLTLLLVTNLGIRLYYDFKTPLSHSLLNPGQHSTDLATGEGDSLNAVKNYNILVEPTRPSEKCNLKLIKFPIVQPIESLQDQINQYPIHQRIKLGSANVINAQNKRISSAVNYKRNLFVILGDDEERKYSQPSSKSYPNQMYSLTINNGFQARAKNNYNPQKIIPECVSLCNIPTNIVINSLAPKEDYNLLTKPLARLLGYELPEHIQQQKFIGKGKAGTISMDCLSELVRQVYYPPHTTLLLDDCELHYLVKFRPVDILYQIIVTNDENEFLQFCERYGRGETCSMLLQLICNSGAKYYFTSDTNRAYRNEAQKTGDKSHYQDAKGYLQPDERTFQIIDLSPDLRQKAIDFFTSIGNSLSQFEFTDHTRKQGEMSLGKFIEPQKRKYTSKLEGLFIYFSRVIRPIWSNYLMNFYVFEGYVPGQISFYKQEDLLILKIRLEEIREFLQNRGSALLVKGSNQDQDQKQFRLSGSFTTDHKANFSYTSTSTTNISQSNRELLSNQARMNEELNEILFEDQKTMENFSEFLEKSIQALDIYMCLINDPLDLRRCIHELGEANGRKFVRLRFHDILRDGEYESLVRSLLYIRLLRVSENQFSMLAQQFRQRFWMFFSVNDAYICQAERNLEAAFNIADELERNRYIASAVEKLKEFAEYIPRERLMKLFDLFINLNLAPEFVRVLIEKIKTLAVLHTRIRNASYNSYDEITKLTLADITTEKDDCREIILSIFQEIQNAIDSKPGIFAHLSPDTLYNLKKRVIYEIQTFDDESLHTTLIRFLIAHRNFEDIFNLESKYIESALIKFTESDDKDIILFDYFKRTLQYEKAFNAALKIATKDQSNKNNQQYPIPKSHVLMVQERLSYLRSACQCLQKSIELSNDHDKRSALIKQRTYLTSLIDKTEIQQKAVERYEYCLTKDHESAESREWIAKIDDLHRQIMDLDILYENYIKKDDLFECQLLVFALEPQPLIQEVENVYDLFINQIYEDDEAAWPKSARIKLLELHTTFAKRLDQMFPLTKILNAIETINANHEPFSQTLQQLTASLVGQNNPKSKPAQFNFNKEDMQYWATYFLTDKLEYSFRQVLEAYRDIYAQLLEEEGTHFLQFHICNCLLVLIEWWLIKAQAHVRDGSMGNLYEKRFEQDSAVSDVYSARDEILDILNQLDEDLKRWGDTKLFDPKLIQMSTQLAGLVNSRYKEVLRNIGDYHGLNYSTSESAFKTTFSRDNKDTKRYF